MTQGGTFRTRPLAWLVGLAVASAIAAILLLAFGEEIAESVSAGPNSYSYSAIGYRGAYAFLGASGVPVARSRDRGMRELDGGSVLFVADPVDGTGEVQGDELESLIEGAEDRDRPMIVVLPKWRWEPKLEKPAWIGAAPIRRPADAESAMGAMLGKGEPGTAMAKKAPRIQGDLVPTWGGRYKLDLERAQILAPSEDLEPLLETADGILIAKLPWEGPEVLVVSDPDLFNNQGLGKGDHAALLLDLVSRISGARSVVFDETIHGYDKRAELLSWLLTFPALPITIHLALVGALAVWVGASRFGSPRRSEASMREGRERFVETAAMAMIGSGGEASSLGRYWSQTLDAIGDGLHLPPAEPEARLERVAGLSARRKLAEDPRVLDREIAEAVEKNARPERWAALAARIHSFRREMLHAPR